MEMPHIETQRQNIRDALQGAREDWIDADTDIERDIQMLAIDELLDVGLKIGAFTMDQLIDKSQPV